MDKQQWPTSSLSSELQYICNEGEGEDNCVNLDNLVPDYLPAIPNDPQASGGSTLYKIAINSNDTLALVAASSTEYNLGEIKIGVPDPEIYLLTYNLNGGVNGPSSENIEELSTFALSTDTPTRDDHTFLEWNTKNDGNGESYNPGDSFTMPSSDTSLYAIWQAEPVIGGSVKTLGGTDSGLGMNSVNWFSNNFVINFWYKHNSYTDKYMISMEARFPGRPSRVYMLSDGRVQFYISKLVGGTWYNENIVSDLRVNDGNWHFVSVYSTGNKLGIRINNTWKEKNKSSDRLGHNGASGVPFGIGGKFRGTIGTAPGYRFYYTISGYFDEVMVFSSNDLSDQDLKNISDSAYNNGIGYHHSEDESYLVEGWHFDDSSSASIKGSSWTMQNRRSFVSDGLVSRIPE